MPTTLEFPERDWNEKGCEKTWGANSHRQHLNSLKGIETKMIWNPKPGQIVRQHLNSLKGIETQSMKRFLASVLAADNTWIPWKGLKRRARKSAWCLPQRPTTLEFPERDWNFLPKPAAAHAVCADNTWIPWKGLKQNGEKAADLIFFLPTTLEFPERDWNKDKMPVPSPSSGSRQHLNSLKGIETLRTYRQGSRNRTDNTWIPWKGLKHKFYTKFGCNGSYPTTLEFPERDWNIVRLLLSVNWINADNTWIPWKGLKRQFSGIRRNLRSSSDNTWIPWKGLKPVTVLLTRSFTMPTTLEFPERDWNRHENPLHAHKNIWPTTLEFPERDWNQETEYRIIEVLSPDNTWIPWKGLKHGNQCRHCPAHPQPTTLEFPERDWNVYNVRNFLTFMYIRQHLNSLKGIETWMACRTHPKKPNRQHLNSLKGIETSMRLTRQLWRWSGPTTLEFPERDWNIQGFDLRKVCQYRQHLNSLKGIETGTG